MDLIMTKPIKPVKAWAVVSGDGHIFAHTANDNKDLVKFKYPRTIKKYEGRIIPVLISPIKKARKK